MTPILQTRIPYDPFNPRALPGIAPLNPAEWLGFDEAFTAQISYRERLLDAQREDVLRMDSGALPAACELLEMVLAQCYQWDGAAKSIQRPDGAEIVLNWDEPLATLGHIAQQDFCILEKRAQDSEHVLTGAVLCFPASWRLSEKFMRPLIAIHKPVAEYDANIAKRVQRLFDGVRVGRPLWRFNALWYADPELHQPRSESAPRDAKDPGRCGYLRSELQSILRLPRSKAVVFSIHTRVLSREDVLQQFERS